MTAHAALTIAIQMDPIADIDITGDTSFALALEAQARGHALYYYTPDALGHAGRQGQRPRAISESG